MKRDLPLGCRRRHLGSESLCCSFEFAVSLRELTSCEKSGLSVGCKRRRSCKFCQWIHPAYAKLCLSYCCCSAWRTNCSDEQPCLLRRLVDAVEFSLLVHQHDTVQIQMRLRHSCSYDSVLLACPVLSHFVAFSHETLEAHCCCEAISVHPTPPSTAS